MLLWIKNTTGGISFVVVIYPEAVHKSSENLT